MARGSSVRDRDKIMMKALKRGMKKKREEKNTIPLVPLNNKLFVIDSLNPGGPVQVKILKTATKNGRAVVISAECPICHTMMFWDTIWLAFMCKSSNHPKRKGIYEYYQLV